MGEQLLFSLVGGSFVGGAAGYLGSLMITKRMALVGDAFGHVALPGMGLALLLHVDPGIGAFVFLALGILLIWKLGERTSLSSETLVGIVFVTSLALGFLVVPRPELLESLIGDISKLSPLGLCLSVSFSVLIMGMVRKIYSGMMLMEISKDLAIVEGVPAGRYRFFYLGCVALIVALGVKVTGSLLVGALVIVPPATARMLSTGLRRYAAWSVAVGVLSNVVGVSLSKATGFPPGPSIILVSAALFTISLGYRRLAAMNREGSSPRA